MNPEVDAANEASAGASADAPADPRPVNGKVDAPTKSNKPGSSKACLHLSFKDHVAPVTEHIEFLVNGRPMNDTLDDRAESLVEEDVGAHFYAQIDARVNEPVYPPTDKCVDGPVEAGPVSEQAAAPFDYFVSEHVHVRTEDHVDHEIHLYLEDKHERRKTQGDPTDNAFVSDRAPLTLREWRSVQASGGGLDRLLALVAYEQASNSLTRAWIALATDAQIQEQWDNAEALRLKDPHLPLFGVPCAIKDNMDVQGFLTTAGCPAFACLPATEDAVAVAKLKAAGAIVIGKTNMDQFASGLVGTRSPYGVVRNACNPCRVSGGSSSGSAVVVSRGSVPFSLGSDTAGSVRLPAGFNNIVGVKPTRGAISTRGVLPACKTLDCVSILAATLQDAEQVLSVVEGFDIDNAYSRFRPERILRNPQLGFGTAEQQSRPRLAICKDPEWFGDEKQHSAYKAALTKAKALGWTLEPIDFTDLFTLASMLYKGGWVAERYIAIKDFLDQAPKEAMDPIVYDILCNSKDLSAMDAFTSEYQRQELTRKIQIACSKFDGILVPTSATFPTIDQVNNDPIAENSKLGIYTNFVNLLDWSALAVPAGFRSDGLPFGMTLISSAWQETRLFKLAEEWFEGEERELGATRVLSQKGDDVLASVNGTKVDLSESHKSCSERGCDDSGVDLT